MRLLRRGAARLRGLARRGLRAPAADPRHPRASRQRAGGGRSGTSGAAGPAARQGKAPRDRYARDSSANLYDAADFLRAAEVARRDADLLERIRERLRTGGDALRVAFLVNDRTKWNGDSLLAAIGDEPRMRARLYLLPSEVGWLDAAARREAYASERAFFADLDAPLRELYDPADDRELPVEEIDADVVFFQQPWGMRAYPRRMSGRTLNVYMHYGFMMMANHGMHYHLGSFHPYLWRYFAQTEGHRALHLEHDPSAYDRVVVTGYPKLDVYADGRADIDCPLWPDGDGKRVVYAPHHSVDAKGPLRMATFAWTHDLLLETARADPAVRWVYKPHPTLRHKVERAGVMTAQAYQDYERAWADLPNGAVYDSGDYFDLFRTSDALVTDSGSFLAEYLPTGSPILWLKAADSVGLNRVGAALAESYYHIEDRDSLLPTFERVVLGGDDPLADRRAEAARRLLPGGSRAADAVVGHLAQEFGLR